jgi:hypothetical protein
MGNVTKSQQNNITSPNGNSLAVFVEGTTGVMKVKDVMGNIQPLSDFVGGGSSPFEYNANASGIQPILGTNVAIGSYSTIGGGRSNTASGSCSTVGGGYSNTTSGNISTVGGGCSNSVSGFYTTVGGGCSNSASGNRSTISGGQSNDASNCSSTIGGGRVNNASGIYSTVSGGISNTVSNNSSTIGGGMLNTASGLYSTIGGGRSNIASGCFSTVVGGRNNVTCSFTCVVIAGSYLTATQNCTTFMNCASVENLTVGCLVSVGANKVLQNSSLSVSTINFGLFAQTADSTPVTATTVESSLIGAGVGTLSVPANGFTIGNSFVARLDGIISAIGTATLHIRIKTVGGVVLADTGIIAMDASTAKAWTLDLEFTVRTLGGVGVASISSGGLFSYIKNSGLNFEGYVLSSVNSTTFDTTINNTLVITAQWNTNNAGNSIFSRNFVLNKIF